MDDQYGEDESARAAEVAAYVSSFAIELAEMSRAAGLLPVASALDEAARAAKRALQSRGNAAPDDAA